MSDIDNIAVHNLFGIEGLNIAWYGIIMAAAIVVGVWVACRQAKKKGYSSELIFDFMILAIPWPSSGRAFITSPLNGTIIPDTRKKLSPSGTEA